MYHELIALNLIFYMIGTEICQRKAMTESPKAEGGNGHVLGAFLSE